MRARSLRVWVLLVLSASLLFSQASSTAPSLFRVDEQKIRFLTEPSSRFELPVFSSAGHSINALIHLELLHTDDKVLGSNDIQVSITPGSHVLLIPFNNISHSDSIAAVYWWRLHYSITPAASDAGK